MNLVNEIDRNNYRLFTHFSARFEVELNNMPRKVQRSVLIYIYEVLSSCIIFDDLWLIRPQFSTNFAFKC